MRTLQAAQGEGGGEEGIEEEEENAEADPEGKNTLDCEARVFAFCEKIGSGNSFRE